MTLTTPPMASAKRAGMQVNLEGRRVKGDSKIPYTNFFLRADSGDIGKLRVAAYGGKRDIMPVYGEKTSALSDDTLPRNSLRYYGDIKNMKTKWGTCNIRARRIWLNLQLAKYPVSCLEYIIIHELTHLWECYHNAHFKSLMDKFCPDWRERKKIINTPLGD